MTGVVVLLLLSVIGCVSDEAGRYYLEETLPAKQISEVAVLRTAPVRPYTVIADFQANYVSIKHMRRRAAEIGADAVIVVHAGGSYSANEIWADSDRYAYTYSRLIATAIKYEPE